MSSVGAVGSAQVFSAINQLNDVVAAGTQAQTDFVAKVAKLAAVGQIDAQAQVAATTALDTVV
jgi:hypothetical protein